MFPTQASILPFCTVFSRMLVWRTALEDMCLPLSKKKSACVLISQCGVPLWGKVQTCMSPTVKGSGCPVFRFLACSIHTDIPIASFQESPNLVKLAIRINGPSCVLWYTKQMTRNFLVFPVIFMSFELSFCVHTVCWIPRKE